MERIKALLRAEPVRVAEAVQAVLAAVAMFTGLITPEQAGGIVAAIIPVLEVVRSIVWAPDSVEAVVVETATTIVEQLAAANQPAEAVEGA